MAHDFHGDARRRAGEHKVRCQRVAQSVEVGAAALRIDKLNACRFQIGAKRIHRGKQISKDTGFAGREFRQQLPQLRQEIRVNGDCGLFVVLSGRSTHVHKGLLGVQVQIRLKQFGKLATAKPRVNGGKINDLASTSNGQQPLHFLVGEGAAVAYLASVSLNLLDEPERIFLQPFVPFHPAQKTGQRGQVVVQRLGCLASLATAPLKERIGSHTRQSGPAAFLEKFPNLFIDDVNVLGIAAHGGQIGEVVFQMIEQRRLLGNALRFWRQQASGFKLPVLNNLLQFLLGNALVGRVQRNVGNLSVAFEPVAATVKTGDFSVTVLSSLGTEDSTDHKFFR